MAATMYFLILSGFIFTVTQSVPAEISNNWDVERSSVNPFSYTDEGHYFRNGTTESPILRLLLRGKKCPKNEHFSRSSTTCQQTCDNYNKLIQYPTFCKWVCVCDSGFIRGPDLKCIKPEECPTKPQTEVEVNFCRTHEKFDFRYAHCQRNCSNYDDVLRCRKIRVSGCVCDYVNGYVRGPNGKCILIEQCPNKTHIYTNPHVAWKPSTDDDYHISEMETNIPSNSKRGNSLVEEIPPISRAKTSQQCRLRERWEPCGGHCQKNCSNKDDKDFDCRPVCIPGCICEEGLVKGPEGKCIEKDECPNKSDAEERKLSSDVRKEEPSHQCPPQERWVPCGYHCQRNCSNKDDKDFRCRPVCIPGCICKEGLVKGPNGKCIEKDKCPNKSD